jgi:N-acetyl sugar amidotransferase
MNSSVPDIVFNQDGICSYCEDFDKNISYYRFNDEKSGNRLSFLAEKIKKAGKGREFDSILGLSGGVDSSYVAYLAHEMGLRPLTVHFDNGWNSEVAVSNIKKIVDKCGFGFETYVIDWAEFRDLQRSFFKAAVVDIEMITDHAILAAMFHYAKKYGIKYILSGENYATEHGMPKSWVWNKQDIVNIRDIQRRFGTLKLEAFPVMGSFKFALIRKLWSDRFIRLLNNVNYKKNDALSVLSREFQWEYYGGKHYESVFTKFYQGYILPTKFGIDKRIAHWSALIRNGEVSREEAMEQLSRPAYPHAELCADKEFVLKKLGFDRDEFDSIMKLKPVPHDFYRSNKKMLYFFSRIFKLFDYRK